MKRILILLLLVWWFFPSIAQVPTGVPTQKINGWIQNWYTVPDSGTVVTRRDTSWTPRFFGTTVTWPNAGVDTSQWFWVGNHWIKSTTAAMDTTPLHNQIILKLNISDTAAMLLPYLRKADTTNKWVQNMYARSDSLFKQKNGTETFVGKFSTAGAGTVTSVALSTPSAFTVAGSPVTSSGTLSFSGAGTSLQYIRGNGTLATFDTTAIPNFYIKVRSLLTPAGSDGQVQFNSSGSFGATSSFAWDNSSNIMTITGSGADDNGFISILNPNGEGLLNYSSLTITANSASESPGIQIQNNTLRNFLIKVAGVTGEGSIEIEDSLRFFAAQAIKVGATNRIYLTANDSIRVSLGATSAKANADSVLGVVNFQNISGIKSNTIVKVPSSAIDKNIAEDDLSANADHTHNFHGFNQTLDSLNSLQLINRSEFVGVKQNSVVSMLPNAPFPLIIASSALYAAGGDSTSNQIRSGAYSEFISISSANNSTNKSANILLRNTQPSSNQVSSVDITADTIRFLKVSPFATTDSVYVPGPFNPALGGNPLYKVPKSAISNAPGGSNTHVQYNNSGAFAGSSFLTWDNALQTLTVTSDGSEDNAVVTVVNGGDNTYTTPYSYNASSTDPTHSPNVGLANNLGKQLQIYITGGTGQGAVEATDSLRIGALRRIDIGTTQRIILNSSDSLQVRVQGQATADSVLGSVNSQSAGGGFFFSKVVKIPYANLYIRDGTLSADRNVASGGFTLRLTGANNSDTLMSINNTGTSSVGLYSIGSLYGVDAQSTTIGLRAFGSSIGMTAEGGTSEGAIIKSDAIRGATIQSVPATTNTVQEVIRLERGSTGGPGGNGIGGSANFYNKVSDNTSVMSNELISKFTTATVGSRISQFSITGVNAAVTGTILTIDGDGTLTTAGKRVVAPVTSSAGTLTIGNAEFYCFNGTTTTWTLPAVSGTAGTIYYLKNIGSGTITLNADSGSNEIYSTVATNTLAVLAGTSVILISNGTYFTTN